MCPPNGVQQREAPGQTGPITRRLKWEPEPPRGVCGDRVCRLHHHINLCSSDRDEYLCVQSEDRLGGTSGRLVLKSVMLQSGSTSWCFLVWSVQKANNSWMSDVLTSVQEVFSDTHWNHQQPTVLFSPLLTSASRFQMIH